MITEVQITVVFTTGHAGNVSATEAMDHSAELLVRMLKQGHIISDDNDSSGLFTVNVTKIESRKP